MALCLVAAAAAGLLWGGRPANLAHLKLRWAPLAIIGFGLQLGFEPSGIFPGTDLSWPLVALLTSFVLLFVFVLANVPTTGFQLILVGVLLNFLVIGVNAGMPVTRSALVRSGQESTLADLRTYTAKHHLAAPDEKLLFLGDVIALPPPIAQAVSIGDIFTYGGAAVVIAAAMRRRPDQQSSPDVLVAGVERAGT